MQNEYRNAIANLKIHLQKRKFTYRDLATGVGMSESGIKKIFSANDGSFQRLAQICEFVGISLTEIIRSDDVTPVSFTPRQQTEFLKTPLLFEIFWLLVYERRNQEEVAQVMKLTSKELFKFLRRLDELDLIKLLPQGRLGIPSVIAVEWKGSDEFVKKMYSQWAQQLVSQVAKPDLSAEEFFVIRYFQMTSQTWRDFVQAQRAIEKEFLRRSIAEMRSSNPSKLKHIRWVGAADTRSFVVKD